MSANYTKQQQPSRKKIKEYTLVCCRKNKHTAYVSTKPTISSARDYYETTGRVSFFSFFLGVGHRVIVCRVYSLYLK